MKTTGYVALTVLALSFAACTQEDDFAPQGNRKLTIASAGVAELTTRATIDDDNNLVEGSIGVYVTSDKGGNYAGENVKWTYSADAGGWSSETTLYFQNNSTAQKIAAYFPYQEDAAEGFTVTLPEEQTATTLEEYDYLYAGYAGVETNSVSISLKHMLAKVKVNISSTGTALDNEAVAKVHMPGMKNGAWWTPEDALDCEDADTGITFAMAPVTEDGKTHFEALAIPDGASSLKLRVITTGGYVFTATATLPEGGLTESQLYTINLTIVGKDKIVVDYVCVKDWTTTSVSEETLSATQSVPSIGGTEYQTAEALAEAVKSKLSEEGVTSVTIDGYLTDEMHAAVISAISELEFAEDAEGAVTNGYLLAGSVTYTLHSSFTDAVSAWNGQDGSTLTMLTDASFTTQIKINGTGMHFDLNGKTVSNSEVNMPFYVESGDLTIYDSTGDDGSLACEKLYSVYVSGSATVNLVSGTLNKGVYVAGGTFNMTGGSIAAQHFCINAEYSDSYIFVSGGEISSESNQAIRTFATTVISGDPVIKSGNIAIVILDTGSVTISGTPSITGGGGFYEFFFYEAKNPVTLNTQPVENETWRMYFGQITIGDDGVVFFVPGSDDITLDADRFSCVNSGYKMQLQEDGSLAVVADSE